MSNSQLICYTKLSPNHSSGRNHKIDRITPHYMDGNGSIEMCGEIFASVSRRASSNYGIGSDGRIGMYVEECNRAWTSGSYANDNRAVTIECANLADGSLTDACWASLVELCADICKRNGIEKLVYTGDDTGNLTMHKWYQSTDCPGPWLSHEFDRLAREVNAILEKPIPPIIKGETPMTFLFTTNGEQSGKVFLYDGGRILHVSGQEKEAITEAYNKATENKIPFFHQDGMSSLIARLGV